MGVGISEDAGNVLPLFAHESGYGRISLAYDREKIYTIPADMEVTMDYLFGKLTELAKKVDTFALCNLKKYLSLLWKKKNIVLIRFWQHIC